MKKRRRNYKEIINFFKENLNERDDSFFISLSLLYLI